MELNDIKLLAFNAAALGISFTEVEAWLKIILLAVTIGYTVSRWYSQVKKNRANEKKDSEDKQ